MTFFVCIFLYVLGAAGTAGVYHQRWDAHYDSQRGRRSAYQHDDWCNRNAPLIAFCFFWVLTVPAFYMWRIGRYLGRPKP